MNKANLLENKIVECTKMARDLVCDDNLTSADRLGLKLRMDNLNKEIKKLNLEMGW